MELNHALNIKLVKAIEKHNVLYDHNCMGYTNRQVQEKAWYDVGEEVGYTGVVCKEKWYNLRSAYTRYLRSEEQVKTKYYLADHMAFLNPFSKPKQKSSTSRKKIKEDTSNSTQNVTQIKYPKVSKNYENEHEVKEPATNDFLFITEKSLYPTDTLDRKRKEIDPLEKCYTSYFTSKERCQLNKQRTTEDADLLFLKSLLPDLHQMTNAQKHEFKLKTIQTIGEILYRPVETNPQHLYYNPSNIQLPSPSSVSTYSQVSTPVPSPSAINDNEFV